MDVQCDYFKETLGNCRQGHAEIAALEESLKVRPTHSNMIFPGPGIGGYCLPKDGGLGVWSYQTLMGFEDDIFKITPLAIDINDFAA